MAMQDDYMINNIKDAVRLLTKLLYGEARMPHYQPGQKDASEETDKLFCEIVSKAEQGDINDAENLLLTQMEPEDDTYLALALTFYLRLNAMDTDFLDDHDYSREEILEGVKSLAEEWGVTGLEYF